MNLRTIAFSSLRRRRSRAAFLVAGMMAGVATVVALLTLSAALRTGAENDLEKYGADIVVTPRSDRLSLSYGGVVLGGVSAGAREIREADLARLKTIPNAGNIAAVAPALLGQTRVGGRRVMLMGVRPADEFKLKQWWSLDGRRPQGPNEVVAGAVLARELGLRPGSTLTMAGHEFTVSGVLRPLGSQDDAVLIADLPVAQRILHKPGVVSIVEVAALCNACPVDKMVTQIDAALPGASATAMQQVVAGRMHALDQFRTFAWVIAAVIVLVEILVVFVTMLNSVNSRTREIGIFRALGFRRGHVTGLILIEAALSSLVAGLLGYLAGVGISAVVLPLLASGDGVGVSWMPPLAAGATLLALTVGCLASLYPAVHASHLEPTEALRAL